MGTLEYILPPGLAPLSEGAVHVSRGQLAEIQTAIERLGGSATLQYTPQYAETNIMAA